MERSRSVSFEEKTALVRMIFAHAWNSPMHALTVACVTSSPVSTACHLAVAASKVSERVRPAAEVPGAEEDPGTTILVVGPPKWAAGGRSVRDEQEEEGGEESELQQDGSEQEALSEAMTRRCVAT